MNIKSLIGANYSSSNNLGRFDLNKKFVNKSIHTTPDIVLSISSSAKVPNFVNKYVKNKEVKIVENTVNNRNISYEVLSGIPSGTILNYVSTTAPEGWLLCDGSEVLISEYSALYNIIKDTYGESSNPNKLFKLPDFRGRVPVGCGLGVGLSKRALGDIGGEENHKLTKDEMPLHSHDIEIEEGGLHNHIVNDAGHEHRVNNIVQKSGKNTVSNTFNKNDTSRIDNSLLTQNNTEKNTSNISIQEAGSHGHNAVINVSGGTEAHNNMQPYIVTNFIIKV